MGDGEACGGDGGEGVGEAGNGAGWGPVQKTSNLSPCPVPLVVKTEC